MYADQNYIVSLRREIHEYPEIGFDLPRTIAVVKRELSALGIAYTEDYGESSVVAVINPEKKHFTTTRPPMKQATNEPSKVLEDVMREELA